MWWIPIRFLEYIGRFREFDAATPVEPRSPNPIGNTKNILISETTLFIKTFVKARYSPLYIKYIYVWFPIEINQIKHYQVYLLYIKKTRISQWLPLIVTLQTGNIHMYMWCYFFYQYQWSKEEVVNCCLFCVFVYCICPIYIIMGHGLLNASTEKGNLF